MKPSPSKSRPKKPRAKKLLYKYGFLWLPTITTTGKALLALSLVLLAGCAEFSYLPYQGAQQDWPTKPGAFISQVDGFPIYHGLPPKPYHVLGRLVAVDATDRQLVYIARTNHADALIITETHTTDGGSVTLPGSSTTHYSGAGSTTIYSPVISAPITSEVQTAWLIQFPGQSRHIDHDPKQP